MISALIALKLQILMIMAALALVVGVGYGIRKGITEHKYNKSVQTKTKNFEDCINKAKNQKEEELCLLRMDK